MLTPTSENHSETPLPTRLSFRRAYAATLPPKDSPWSRLSTRVRSNLIYAFWLATFVLLATGLFDSRFNHLVVLFTAAHALTFASMVKLRPMVFPVQLRIATAGWLALGAYVPALGWIMVLTTIGLAANLAFGYCLLARLLSLLPWNREHSLSVDYVAKTLLTPPRPGRFSVATSS